jgi:putative flippase GtrA
MNKTMLAFTRFLLVGGFATALQYVILFVLVHFTGMNAVLASGIGYVISAIFNYVLSYRFTFESTQAHRVSAPRFLIIGLCGLILNSVILEFATEGVGLNLLTAQIMATVVTLAWNFIANGIWSFRSNALKLRARD